MLPVVLTGALLAPAATPLAAGQGDRAVYPEIAQVRTTPRPGRRVPTAEEQKRREQRARARAARRFELQGAFEQALAIYRSLLDQQPESGEFFDGVRRNLMALSRYDEAQALLEDRLDWARTMGDRHEISAVYAQMGEVQYLAGRRDRAEIDWREALASNPGDPSAYLTLAQTYLRLRLTDRAVATLRRAREDLGDESLFAINLAMLLQATMDWEGAAREYLVSLRGSPSRKSYVLRSLANFPNTRAANEAVRRAVEEERRWTAGKEPWPDYRLALLEILASQRMKNGDFSGALDLVARLDEAGDEPGARLIEFASDAHAEGADSVARRALRMAGRRITDAGGRAGVDIALGGLAEAQGNWREADSLYSLYCVPSAPSRVRYVARKRRGLLRLNYLGDPAGAAEDFAALLAGRTGGETAELHYLHGLALARQGRLDEAEEELALPGGEPRAGGPPPPVKRIGRVDGLAADALVLRARIALWKGDTARAAAFLDSLLARPGGYEAENEALLLQHLVASGADSLALRAFAAADSAEFSGDSARALSGYHLLAGEEVGALAAEAAWREARLLAARGGREAARALASFAQRFPASPRAEEAWITLGSLMEARGDTVEAITAYESLLLDHPEGLLAQEARWLLDHLAGGGTPGLPPMTPQTP